jgi:hypothetical protein
MQGHSVAGKPVPTHDLTPARSFTNILPCEVCGYDLNGLGVGTCVICPECGLEQPRRTRRPPWPRGLRAAAWQCGVTLALCNLCLVLLLLLVLLAPGVERLLLLAAGVTFLSGPVVPVASGWWLARRHGPKGVHRFIPMGWLWNFLIGMGYLVAALAVGVLMP